MYKNHLTINFKFWVTQFLIRNISCYLKPDRWTFRPRRAQSGPCVSRAPSATRATQCQWTLPGFGIRTSDDFLTFEDQDHVLIMHFLEDQLKIRSRSTRDKIIIFFEIKTRIWSIYDHFLIIINDLSRSKSFKPWTWQCASKSTADGELGLRTWLSDSDRAALDTGWTCAQRWSSTL